MANVLMLLSAGYVYIIWNTIDVVGDPYSSTEAKVIIVLLALAGTYLFAALRQSIMGDMEDATRPDYTAGPFVDYDYLDEEE